MTHDVERVLADIDADHGDRCVEFLRHGVLLVLSAPCQLLILAGPEHGRTIPLPDIGRTQWKCARSRFLALSDGGLSLYDVLSLAKAQTDPALLEVRLLKEHG